MSLFQAIILGLVQGLTEFFPVSSSAHLRLAKMALGVEDGEHLLYFDLLCHLGTLLALIFYLRKDVWDVLKDVRKMGLYFLALIPLIPAYFLLKPLRVAASEPQYLGFALMITGALLFTATKKREINPSKKWPAVLCIGVMQTMALIPGISRSGSTITAGRLCGWEWREAAKFSYLLAIPTILGGELLETLKGRPIGNIAPICYVGGFLASLALGLVAVRFIFWIYETGKVKPFAWYCLSLGIFAWAIFNG
ncbi:MAG: undecaprenyl-diphosphate phosphatase [Chlamydiae bacterium CG10_big_fil_rev_8_21_14_0_10_42_34]|nr:MAG: undecaprenyl-diphosphate phosphatase [Chlamydiae bacterium CG10_big_fil_rev_8_21_14_0_10_42_34]